jgi:MtfA peptidase
MVDSLVAGTLVILVMVAVHWLNTSRAKRKKILLETCFDATARNPYDGNDLVIHEFPHLLDQANPFGEGLPELKSLSLYREWSSIMQASFGRFFDEVDKGRKTVIDAYASTSPAEFFAVVTETYLEKPRQLKNHYPDLYQIIDQYYQLDPISWKKYQES